MMSNDLVRHLTTAYEQNMTQSTAAQAGGADIRKVFLTL